MMKADIKYTILPWMNTLSAGRILPALAVLLVLYAIGERLFRNRSLTMRRGTLAIIGNTVWPIILNTGVYTVAFWYWALPLAAANAAIFWIIIRGELRTAREEEMEGAWGTFPAIRQIRGEAFADLSVEEQLAYKARVRPTRFWWWLWLPAVIILPFLIVLLLARLGVGDYLFQVVYFE